MFLDLELSDAKLIEPWTTDLGTESDIKDKKISIRIGQRPTAVNLKELYEKTGKELPDEYVVYDEFDIWLITHTVGIVNKHKNWVKKVKSFGYKMQYNEEDFITIIDILPQTKFIKQLSAGLGVEADISLNGSLDVPSKDFKFGGKSELLNFGGNLDLGLNANLVGRLSFDIITPMITAIGEGDFIGEWVFKKNEQPLIGMQKMIQTILVPEGTEEIAFKASVNATLTTFNLLPDRRKSEWITLKCVLA